MQISIDVLRSALTQIEQAIGGPVTKPPRSQLLKTIDFLNAHAGTSLEELVTTLEAAKPPPKVKAASPKPRATKPKLPVQMQVVDKYVAELRRAENSLTDFNSLVAILKGDKAVRVEEMKLIASDYSGDTSSLKSKVTALGVIQRAFDARWSIKQHEDRIRT